MARRLRIEFPGAFYHVYSRGNQKEIIFFDDADRFYFLKLLGDANERLSAEFHVYCLMPNHYHFILGTPQGNLSQIMHFVNTAFSIYLNLKHQRCGHVFQGRFNAILMDAESYARVLTMYIHGNPVRKKLVSRPEEFEWSSSRAYFGLTTPQAWLQTAIIFSLFGGSVEVLKAEHDSYLGSAINLQDTPEFLRAGRIGILGTDEFIEKIRRSFLKRALNRKDEELPEISRLRKRPEISEIHSRVRAVLGSKNRFAKKATIFIAHKNTNYKLKDIGEFFNIGPIAVAVAFRKMKTEVTTNEPLRDAVQDIEESIFRSDPEVSGKL